MHVFLDFEASSLAKDSYPIEVGWVFEGGTGAESWLIRPAPDWTDWDPNAGNQPRHAMRLAGTNELHIATATAILDACMAPERALVEATALAGALRGEAESWPAAHRALPDAERERAIWLELKRRAEGFAGRQNASLHTQGGES
jgi:hypothetical protein